MFTGPHSQPNLRSRADYRHRCLSRHRWSVARKFASNLAWQTLSSNWERQLRIHMRFVYVGFLYFMICACRFWRFHAVCCRYAMMWLTKLSQLKQPPKVASLTFYALDYLQTLPECVNIHFRFTAYTNTLVSEVRSNIDPVAVLEMWMLMIVWPNDFRNDWFG